MFFVFANDCVLVLIFVILTKGKNCSYHYIYDARRLSVVNVTLADVRLGQLLLIFKHLNLIWSPIFVRTIVNVVGSEEFGNDESIHPTEETPEDDEACDNLCPEFGELLEVDGVGCFAEYTEAHVKDCENNGHLHFDTVDE